MTNAVMQVIPTGIGNQFVVWEDRDYLLIDTGLRNNYTNLVNFLARQRILSSDIKMIVITHADGDHYGCLDQLLKNSKADILTASSELEAEAIGKGKSSRPLRAKGFDKVIFDILSPLFTSKPVKIKRILLPGEILPYLGGLKILDTRGHTPGHISLWSEREKILFSGDSINIHEDSLSPSFGANTWDEGLAVKSFDMQMALQPEIIYGGHGVWKKNK